MSDARRARDLDLLDALEALERVRVDSTVWRAVRKGCDPLSGSATAGRWDPGTFDVLYTALERDGAIAEMHFHLSRQPVFPSKVDFTVTEIAVRTMRTLKFADLNELKPLGVNVKDYAKVLYRRTQEIGDAAAFLGFDGIIAPSARWDCHNLVIFSDQVRPDDLELIESSVIDFAAWRRESALDR
jgi:RES domain-containing protein